MPKYATTLQEDLDMLERDKKENNLTVNERNIVKLRATEKQIIKVNMEYAQFVLEITAMTREEAVLATKKIPKHLESALDLIQYIIVPLLPKQATKK